MVMENAPIRLAVQMHSSHALPDRASLLASVQIQPPLIVPHR